MFGTIVNVISIIIGSVIGLALKNGLSTRYKNIIMSALGLSALYVGFSGALQNLLDENAHQILFLVSLVLGAIIGEFMDIEGRLQKFGEFIESKFKNSESNIAKGFVASTLLYCVGTMAILGPINSSLSGDHSILYVKSLLDGIMSIMLASSLGFGVLLSAFSVFLYQGIITIFASSLQTIITPDMMREISIIGGILISAIGLDVLEIKTIKIGNMLPAIIFPVIFYLFV